VVLALAGAAAMQGCREAPAGAPPAPAPGDSQVAGDLVGVRFAFFEDAQGEKHWTIEEGEVRDLRVIDGVTAADGRRHRARVRLTLAATNRTIRGDMDAYYRRAGAAWVFDEAARAGANWAVEELAAVVYDVRRSTSIDTTSDGRDVWLEPMFRYHDGAYSVPLAPFESAIRAFRDSSFASDSLRLVSRAALEDRIARRYLNPSWTVFLLAPGDAPAPARFASREAVLWGCTQVAGRVRAASADAAARTSLATSSSTMGGAAFAGREPSPQEADRLAALARSRLEALGAPPDRLRRLRAGRAVAVDLDGDGTEEFIGAFGVAGAAGAPDVGLVIAGRPAPAAFGPVVERASHAEDGMGALDLVGAVDVDGDGDLEIVAREYGVEAYRYVVLARRPEGSWEEVYAGGGCGDVSD